jgi:hypothetical protein
MAGVASAGDEEAEISAKQWLALVDAGQCAASYDAAASAFKEQVKKKKWLSYCESMRKDTGTLVSRKLDQRVYLMSLPKMHAGYYALLKFDEKFQRWRQTWETVFMVREKDDVWRVVHYEMIFEYAM